MTAKQWRVAMAPPAPSNAPNFAVSGILPINQGPPYRDQSHLRKSQTVPDEVLEISDARFVAGRQRARRIGARGIVLVGLEAYFEILTHNGEIAGDEVVAFLRFRL